MEYFPNMQVNDAKATYEVRYFDEKLQCEIPYFLYDKYRYIKRESLDYCISQAKKQSDKIRVFQHTVTRIL